jgi:hypothetical protein
MRVAAPARKKAAVPAEPTPQAVVTGKVVMRPIADVRPNTWNPNHMTQFMFDSLVAGFKEDGWLASDALLVWGTDEKGKRRDVIIDGEHRWKVAGVLGILRGPMVFLDGLTEAQAKALTVKKFKRGDVDQGALSVIVKDLLPGYGDTGLLGMSLGLDSALLQSLINPKPTLPPSDFQDVDVNVTIDFKCPSCGYEWRGRPK